MVLFVIQCAYNWPSWCRWDVTLVKLQFGVKSVYSQIGGRLYPVCCHFLDSVLLFKPSVIRQREDRPASRRAAPHAGELHCLLTTTLKSQVEFLSVKDCIVMQAV